MSRGCMVGPRQLMIDASRTAQHSTAQHSTAQHSTGLVGPERFEGLGVLRVDPHRAEEPRHLAQPVRPYMVALLTIKLNCNHKIS